MKKLCLLFAFIWSLASAGAAITRVQSVSGNTGIAASTTLVLTLGATPTAGNVILLALSATAPATVEISYGSNITWTGHPNFASGSITGTMWIGRVYPSASATITITASQALAMAAVAVEYSGSNIITDRAAEAIGSSATVTSGTTATTSTANEIWTASLAFRSTGTNTFSAPTNSFTIVDQSSTNIGTTGDDRSVCFLEFVASSTGTPNTAVTASFGINNFSGQIMTLKEAATSIAASYSWGG